MILAWIVAINSTSNEEFPVKTLEDQQKICVAFIRLISTLVVLGHCAICKYIYQNWMEGVINERKESSPSVQIVPQSSHWSLLLSMLPCRSPVDAFCTRKRMQGTQERPCKSSALYSMYREAHNHGTRKLHPNTHSASPVTTHSQKSMQSNYYTHSHNVRKKNTTVHISRLYIFN